MGETSVISVFGTKRICEAKGGACEAVEGGGGLYAMQRHGGVWSARRPGAGPAARAGDCLGGGPEANRAKSCRHADGPGCDEDEFCSLDTLAFAQGGRSFRSLYRFLCRGRLFGEAGLPGFGAAAGCGNGVDYDQSGACGSHESQRPAGICCLPLPAARRASKLVVAISGGCTRIGVHSTQIRP